MRVRIAMVVVGLIVALAACAGASRRSRKDIARDVSMLLTALLPPMVGNLVIILSSNEAIATLGCYTYYLGMDLTTIALFNFTLDYCSINYRNGVVRRSILVLVLADMVQLLLNPLFGHAFATEPIMVDGMPYFSLVPFAGQAFHRLVCYGLFFAALVIFLVKTVRSPRVYVERYLVIFLVMVFAGAWQSFYIFSGVPVDRSMIGFGVFGLLIFYFSIIYRPVRLLDRMLARVVSDMSEAFLFFDPEGTCIYANTAAMAMLRLRDELDVERSPRSLTKRFGWLELGASEDWQCQRRVDDADNPSFYQLDYHRMTDARGQLEGAFLSIRDRTQEELELRRETYNATHDRLTGLYNKEHLYDCIRRTLDKNPTTQYIVVAMDVKDFKIINDIFSSEFGDIALRTIADWMRSFAAAGAVYGRLSGDKFGFLAPAAAFDADSINRRLAHYVVTDGDIEQPILLHLGVYEVNEPEIDVSVMFDRAFMAMATVKGDYQNHIAYYDDAMREKVLWDQQISSQLADAIAERQIRPYLQPMVDDAGNVVGAEVLVRWIHPKEGFLSPARFIPVFEENGMVAQLDRHMWRCACELLADWQRRGIDLFLSVNISPKDFYFINVGEEIRSLVAEFGIDPKRLRLEITETVMMTDLENRLRIIEGLRDDGFLVEMDDFGSGYSSLNMLKDMPVDVLKIDMMFLYKTKDQGRARTILQNIINLSGDLGIPSLTEGVETSDQHSMLMSMGCKLFQGYYFAKPMPVAEFEEYLSAA